MIKISPFNINIFFYFKLLSLYIAMFLLIKLCSRGSLDIHLRVYLIQPVRGGNFNEGEVRGEILILFMFGPREGKEGEGR
jgi:hypothetical protein